MTHTHTSALSLESSTLFLFFSFHFTSLLFFDIFLCSLLKGYTAITSLFPVGVVSMIVPFNFPVNLAAHKIAPAIAAGCPFVLKPSDRTPISTYSMKIETIIQFQMK
jgi:hypothetical protein